ncbi:hypothetical protein CSQ89_21760 [Chitinimonas sp. BJB300]|nr:hypothetical protein CSQ89_21760 [Chitinimonas sp. BJB300]TSJ84594.1 hypothetical protein FG002_019345 [Chitinimonas sp. BJB300]
MDIWLNLLQSKWRLVTRLLVLPRERLRHWQGGQDAATHKYRLFNDRALGIALKQWDGPLLT